MSEHNSTERGRVVWFSSDEDGGPDCGLSIGLGDGRALYIGELADQTLADSGVDIAAIDGGSGWWVTLETPKALSVIGPVTDTENAREMFDCLTGALNFPAPPDAGSGGIAATKPQALDELISSDELAEMDLLAERSAGLAFAGTVRRLVAAYRSLAPTPSDEIRERVARIIEPVAWENRETHLRIANGPHTILARTTARRNADASVESSFAKADQILALLKALQSKEGEGNE